MRSEVPMKTATKKSSTSKSHAKTSGNIIMATDQVYQIALKSILSSIVPHCPKEILVEISKFINTIYPKLKDPCLNTIMENDTVKRRELAWKNVTSKIQDVLFPLMQATNAEQKLLLEVPSPSQTASVQEEHQAERKANNIMEIETLPNSTTKEVDIL